MATSGSVDYTLNRNQLITAAYELVGVGVEGESLEPEQVTIASRVLNVMIKAWQSHGLHLWTRNEQSITLVASKASYTLGRSGSPDVTMDRPLRVLECNRKGTSGDTTAMLPLSKNEYYNLPNRTTEGTPIQYHFDPTLSNSTIYFWLVPNATAVTDFTIEIVVESPIEDMDNATDNFDWPQYWEEALMYGLAYRLAPRVGLPDIERLRLRSDMRDALEEAKGYDVETTSVYFQPDTSRNR